MSNSSGKKPNRKRVIPGFGLSMGLTITTLSVVVFIPLCALALTAMQLSPSEFIQTITRARVLSSFRVSILCSLIAAVINLIMGVITAWVLVRYDFPGKRLIDGLIELPFALPTAIAGITLTSLLVETGPLGAMLSPLNIKISYTPVGIIIALIFVGIPFVVRAIEPVLKTLDAGYEEAADMMGSTRKNTFLRVIWPEIRPAALTGFALAFARGLGEYGSVVFIAGNKPYSTEVMPLMIMSQLQEYDYGEATALALCMLAVSFVMLLIMNIIQIRAGLRTKQG